MTIQPSTYKEALSRLASGVTVVTTHYAGERHGLTASSFNSVCLDPPLVLICVAQHLRSYELIKQSGVFAVSVLRAEQLEWGKRFAGMIPDIDDRFAGIDCSVAETGCPILPNALSWVDCELYRDHDAGDHTIFIGKVLAGGTNDLASRFSTIIVPGASWQCRQKPCLLSSFLARRTCL